MMENKIAVLGSSDFVMPFSVLGLDTFAVSDSADEIHDSASKIIESKYTLIVVAENIAPIVEQVFEPIQKKTLPAVVVVPFTTESTGFATESLGEALKMATGVNILENN
jgi:vacuolar-type H+-ATPase subunit F/Vma7